MKIILCENSEGFSSYTHQLVNSLIKIDDNIDYLTPIDNKYLNCIDSHVNTVTLFDSYFVKYNRGSFRWFVDRMSITCRNLLKRNKYIKKKRPDVVNIQCTVPVIDQYLLKDIKKYSKLVLTVHDVIPPIESRNWSKKSLTKIYNISDSLVVHTNANRQQLIEEFGISTKKISVIHHGVKMGYKTIDVEHERHAIGINNSLPVILFYGLIRPQKGLDVLLEALKGIPCNLLIAGKMPEGESFDKYQRIIEKNKINVISIIEYISEDFTNVLYQISDYVALPYKYFYSQSGVFMQAIQYKKPVVVSSIAAFPEYIEKYQIGVLCEPDNVSSLHNAILQLIENGKSYSDQMHTAALDNSWAKSAEKYYTLFSRMGRKK